MTYEGYGRETRQRKEDKLNVTNREYFVCPKTKECDPCTHEGDFRDCIVFKGNKTLNDF